VPAAPAARHCRPEGVGIFAGVAHHEEIGEHRDHRAFLKKRGEQLSAHRRGHFERSFIGLDLRHYIARRDRISGTLHPAADDALFHRVAELGNFHRCGHLPVALHQLPPHFAELAERALGSAEETNSAGVMPSGS
jgi:hypothetical protein